MNMTKNMLALALALFSTAALAQGIGRGGNLRDSLRRRVNAVQPELARTSGAEAKSDESAEAKAEASDLNFSQTPLDLVFETYGRMVGKTILKDPATPSATITLKSEPGQKLSKEEQIEAIEIILEMNGVHLEPYGEKFIRALPRKDVRKEGIPLIMDPETKLGESGRVVSMMIPFKNISTEEAQKALEGFKSNSGILLVFERTNSILVTDTEQNINRMLEIARSIDIATPVLENVFVRQIKNANATEIKTALEAIVQEAQKELEKAGKAARNAAAQQPARPPFLAGNRLLGRRNPAEQPAAAANNPSLVMSVSDADRGMIRGKVLILADERSNKLIIVTQKANMDFFDKVIEQLDIETTPDTVVKVYRLKYAEAEEVSDMINDLIGNASNSSGGKANQNKNAKAGKGANITRNTPAAKRTPANQRSGEAKAGELSKDNTTVLADKRINGLVVMTNKELVPVLENIIESMDVKLSQVLIETVIVEISLGDNLKTGVDWVMGGKVAQSVFMNHGQMIGGGAGTTQLGNFAMSGLNNATNIVTPIGKGIQYLVKSDKLNLAAVVQASKTDNRTKYVASPIVMTVDNKEASIEATSSRQFLTGWSAVSSSYAGSGLPSPNYTAKDIGITLKIKPKINPNGTVMLNVEEEYSQVSGTQDMLTPKGQTYEPQSIDVAVTRKMTADISLENGESVILGGLTTKTTSEKESGIPILKDIPWVGKWLFGSVEQDEQSSELLVFMTPYVLDDAAAAKAEALRRKKTMSDPTPWEDGGWSASDLADPVSQKEQLRRIKDEWKRQDAERRTRQAIEREKINRVKELEKMSEDERKAWLELHKDDLQKEARRDLEKKMLDAESQTALRQLADEVRANKLAAADAAITKDTAKEQTAQKEIAPAAGGKKPAAKDVKKEE
jgi:general secretion pathway protein D